MPTVRKITPMKRTLLLAGVVLVGLLPVLPAAPAGPAQLKILLPLGRVAYQTNEWIDISVVRTGPDGLAGGPLVLRPPGDNGSRLDFPFAVKPAAGKPAVSTEHLHVNGYLL